MRSERRARDRKLRNSRPTRQERLDFQEKEAKKKLDLVALDEYYAPGEDYDSLNERVDP